MYIGVTSDLQKRLWEHKNKVIKGFTSRYNIDRLVHFEIYDDPNTAIQREKSMKEWKRKWKIELIEQNNPEWTDLHDQICT
ncbi:Excinuclease ABC, C subunit-like protein [Micavibrio aeruginosavorus EPB]|uniref:Excinuclease ABC, C subunit-like protein n=1 Tax=Micavibrio aeruginosavorus EPB TaxID=349215 RepID=M4VJT2_9BACT|nr:Excinuclease ABC, C subunit-like protein [Micavibrio aeruginosavorus EPB]